MCPPVNAPEFSATQMLDRTELRRAFRADEETCIAERMEQARPASKVRDAATQLAVALIEGARARKASGIDAFLQQFGLDTEEGIAAFLEKRPPNWDQ